jgi:hypothetical protein
MVIGFLLVAAGGLKAWDWAMLGNMARAVKLRLSPTHRSQEFQHG